MLSDAAEDNRP